MTDLRLLLLTGRALALAVLCLASAAEAREPAAGGPMHLAQLARPSAAAGLLPAVTLPEAQPLRMAGGDCSGAAAQAAADSGGQVLSVSSSEQGGRTVCIVTVLIPGEDGGRPRKKTITIPQ
ncbi:hypothetical protein [Aureimonas glaciei]|uniref:Uncharacterized protein n=1 Tax=Aureimonas glaciei TaxID=1776957 RepID=A0A916XUA5_9HYPH|nr:hypothetical protein [Aureimonas glaciei]GGD12561.1 hypothetical protein GCM10011335_14280 [Aureimonas glaciei]